MKKFLLLTTAIIMFSGSANAEITLDPATTTQAQMEQAIADAIAANETADITSFLVTLATLNSPLFMPLLASVVSANPDLSSQMVQDVVIALQDLQGQEVTLALLDESYPDIMASLQLQGIEPAAGDDNQGRNRGLFDTGGANADGTPNRIPAENPAQNSPN